MSFKGLKDESKLFHIVMTTSDRAKAFVKADMQKICGIEPRETGYAKSKEQVRKLINEYTVPPFLTEEWLGVIEYSHSLSELLKDSKQKIQTGYGRYIIFCSSYRDFKEAKDLFLPALTNTLYLSRLNFIDINYILGRRATKLSEKLMNDVCNSYSRNIDAIFDLAEHIDQGWEIETKKDLERVCGLPDADLNTVVINLAKQVADWQDKYEGKTYKEWAASLKKSIPSKLKPLLKTSESYSPQYIRVSLDNIIYNMVCIKQLYINCDIYRAEDIKDLPEDQGYDVDSLKRLVRYYDKIIEIPVYALLYIYEELSRKDYWHTKLDIMEFVYHLFGESVDLNNAVF